jgi:glycosyltransferase involved in cell wall biosynthesis
MKIGLASNFQDEVENIVPIWDIFKDVVDMWTVVDSGSTDGTQEKLKEVVGDKLNLVHSDKIRNVGYGYGYARTKLIELSDGMDWVLIVDGDERMLSEDIAKLKPVIETNASCDIVFLPRCHYQNWEMTKVEYGSMDVVGSDWKVAVSINPDWQARLIKRTMVEGKSKVQFKRPVHEIVYGSDKVVQDLHGSPVIRHFGWMKSPERLKMIANLCRKLSGLEEL